jgi:predicted Zn-dependent protease
LTSTGLLAATPEYMTHILEAARPLPLSADLRARILNTLPEEGDVTTLDAASRQKLRAMESMLVTLERESAFVIKVIDVPQAVIALHARYVVLLSRPALVLLSSDELRALLAHEIGHAYVWSDYQRASRARDAGRLQDLELVCDVIAIVRLSTLGFDPSPLLDALEKLTRFNHERFGAADNERLYPTLTRRKAVARAMEQRFGTAHPIGPSDAR